AEPLAGGVGPGPQLLAAQAVELDAVGGPVGGEAGGDHGWSRWAGPPWDGWNPHASYGRRAGCYAAPVDFFARASRRPPKPSPGVLQRGPLAPRSAYLHPAGDGVGRPGGSSAGLRVRAVWQRSCPAPRWGTASAHPTPDNWD